MKERVRKSGTKKTKLFKRSISVLMALSLTLNVTPFDMLHTDNHALFDIFSSNPSDSFAEKVSAAELTYTVTDNDKTRFAGNTSFADNATGKANFLDFCYFYQTDNEFAEQYADATVSVSFITFPAEFMGLGNKTVKFRGDFRIQDDGNADINIPRAIFTHVYDSARITNAEGLPLNLKVAKTSDQSSPLIADYVYHDKAAGAVPASWDVTVSSNNGNPYAGVIGEIKMAQSLPLHMPTILRRLYHQQVMARIIPQMWEQYAAV